MRKPVDYYSNDVLETYKTLTAHWPLFSSDDLAVFPGSVQPFFRTPKLKVKKNDDVWFFKTPVGKNTLGQTVKQIILSTPGIGSKGRNFSKKMPRRIGISCMEEAMVPVEKGMRITGHMYIDDILVLSFKIISIVLNCLISFNWQGCKVIREVQRSGIGR
jgi:hypothetical protein